MTPMFITIVLPAIVSASDSSLFNFSYGLHAFVWDECLSLQESVGSPLTTEQLP